MDMVQKLLGILVRRWNILAFWRTIFKQYTKYNETAIMVLIVILFNLYDSYGDGMCCTYGIGSVSVYDVSGNVNFYQVINLIFILLLIFTLPTATVSGCTDSTALNYDPLATIDDGSCIYPSTCTPVP